MGYSEVEQWAFALVLACRKFRRYLLPKKFVVVTSSNMLPDVILHLKPGKRIMKWVLELQEFGYEFLIDHTVQAHLSDVLVNTSGGQLSYPK